MWKVGQKKRLSSDRVFYIVAHPDADLTTYGPRAACGPRKDFLWPVSEILFKNVKNKVDFLEHFLSKFEHYTNLIFRHTNCVVSLHVPLLNLGVLLGKTKLWTTV
jgi:hypothetical protein